MKEIRGVWIANRPHSQVFESRQNIVEAMNFLQDKGFNLVFPVVWNQGYTLFPSQVMSDRAFPKIDPFYGEQKRDPLGEIITEAEKRNIKVIPWFEYGFAASHLDNGGHILQTNPHWAAINQDGNIVKHGGLLWMNPFNPEVQQLMLELVLEVINKYQVAGIQGCDRFPALPVDSGYDPVTIKQFEAKFAKKPPKNPKDKQWLQWRADILTNFLAQLYSQVKAVNNNLIVSVAPAVYPFCLDNLLQDSKTWVEQGIVDLIHPQIYRSSFFAYCHEVEKIKKTFSGNSFSKFAPGIAFKANNQDISSNDLLKCLKLNRKSGFGGQVFFHYEGLRKDNDAMAAIIANSDDYTFFDKIFPLFAKLIKF
jgi:uncharacterized lipoprotein YddW (UPF0748 family)